MEIKSIYCRSGSELLPVKFLKILIPIVSGGKVLAPENEEYKI
jgi:hypothetical protein